MKQSAKLGRSSVSGRFIGTTEDGIRVMRPHLPPKNVDLEKLRSVISNLKKQKMA